IRPALRRLAGHGDDPACVKATMTEEFAYRTDRPTYHPARVEAGDDGWSVRPVAWFGSADLRALLRANALVLLDEGERVYPAAPAVPRRVAGGAGVLLAGAPVDARRRLPHVRHLAGAGGVLCRLRPAGVPPHPPARPRHGAAVDRHLPGGVGGAGIRALGRAGRLLFPFRRYAPARRAGRLRLVRPGAQPARRAGTNPGRRPDGRLRRVVPGRADERPALRG